MACASRRASQRVARDHQIKNKPNNHIKNSRAACDAGAAIIGPRLIVTVICVAPRERPPKKVENTFLIDDLMAR
jgi:hypothetical protein